MRSKNLHKILSQNSPFFCFHIFWTLNLRLSEHFTKNFSQWVCSIAFCMHYFTKKHFTKFHKLFCEKHIWFLVNHSTQFQSIPLWLYIKSNLFSQNSKKQNRLILNISPKLIYSCIQAVGILIVTSGSVRLHLIKQNWTETSQNCLVLLEKIPSML